MTGVLQHQQEYKKKNPLFIYTGFQIVDKKAFGKSLPLMPFLILYFSQKSA